jgi:hypothetical protein
MRPTGSIDLTETPHRIQGVVVRIPRAKTDQEGGGREGKVINVQMRGTFG